MAGLRLSQKTFNTYRDALALADHRWEAEAKPVIETMTAYFKGDQWARPAGTTPGSLPQVTANLVFADVKVMLPVLALRNPRVFIKPTGATKQMPTPTPRGPEMRPVQVINGQPVPILDVARAQEALSNWRWKQLKIVKQVRRCLMDMFLAPFGIMKIGYEMATEKVDLDSETPELLEPNELITAEAPYAVRWSPMDFRVDPEARYADLSDASWIAFGTTARLEDVKRNGRFKNTRDLQGTVEVKQDWGAGTTKKPRLSESTTGSPDDYQRVRLWEIWNKRTQMRMVLAEDHDKALEYVDWPQAYKGFPCETIYATEHPDCLYGPPDLRQILGQQDAYNQFNSMILNHNNRFVRKFVTTRGAFDEKELEKLKLPIDGLVVETDGTPKDSIIPVPDANVPVDVWQARANFREDHDRVSGVADFVRGVAEKVDTATEAAALQANLNVRTNDARAIVEDFAERITAKLLAIDVQTLNLPAVIPIIGPDGAQVLGQFVQIADRAMLAGDFTVEIEIGSMQPVNEQVQKRDTLELFTLLKNDPLVDQFKLREMLVPAYREHVPGVESLFLTRDQFEALQMRQILLQQQGMAMGQKAGAGGPPGRPGGGPPGVRPAGPPRPAMAAAGGRPGPPGAASMGRSPLGAAGPKPVPGPTDQEV